MTKNSGKDPFKDLPRFSGTPTSSDIKKQPGDDPFKNLPRFTGAPVSTDIKKGTGKDPFGHLPRFTGAPTFGGGREGLVRKADYDAANPQTPDRYAGNDPRAWQPMRDAYPVNDAAVSRAADAEQTLPDDSESRRASEMQRNKIANTLPAPAPRQAEDADEAALENERNEQEQSSMADARQAEDMNRLAALQSQNESARQAYTQGMIAQTSKKAAASINRYIWQIAGSLGMIPVDGSETYSVGTSVSTYQLIMGALSRMGSDLDEGIQKSPLGYVIPPGHGKDIIGMFMIVYSVFLLLWSGVVATLIIVAIMYMLDLIFPGSSDALFSILST